MGRWFHAVKGCSCAVDAPFCRCSLAELPDSTCFFDVKLPSGVPVADTGIPGVGRSSFKAGRVAAKVNVTAYSSVESCWHALRRADWQYVNLCEAAGAAPCIHVLYVLELYLPAWICWVTLDCSI
ncbi:unnamed protein product [Symbiodinium natans]|uniref:Uncharacterized protein n=1 Tax=Symbiodinium natans TaxID=878477 RepID=A0A812KP45_9DINO|nr:unnamed protein product [Symbiodinium natans]